MSLQTFFADREQVAAKLQEAGDLSLVNTFATDLPRVFIVAAASNFEVTITQQVIEFFRSTSSQPGAAEFIERKALMRTYHSLFEWKSNSVKSFFQFFGVECREHYVELTQTHEWLEPAAKDFLALGRARNLLVHGDFSTHSPAMTADEVKSRCASAQRFVEAIPAILRLEELTAGGENGS